VRDRLTRRRPPPWRTRPHPVQAAQVYQSVARRPAVVRYSTENKPVGGAAGSRW